MTSATQRVGRRRDTRVDAAIVAATREVLAESGYAGLTVDAVAARAGIGKAAIYRRFPAKQHMIFAAAVHDLDIQPPDDTGTFAGDLAALVANILSSMTAPTAAVLPNLMADLWSDPALARQFGRTFLSQEMACVREVLERGVARGELAAMPDLAGVYALLHGPLFIWVFALRRPDEVDVFAAQLTGMVAGALLAGN